MGWAKVNMMILESVKLLAETCDCGIPKIPALFLPEERDETVD